MKHLPDQIGAPKTCHIFIHNLELMASIGLHPHEFGYLQPLRISVDLEANEVPDEDGAPENMIDYAIIASKIRDLVKNHIRIIETLASRIADTCLSDPHVLSVRVRVEKLKALVGAESAGAEIRKVRPVNTGPV